MRSSRPPPFPLYSLALPARLMIVSGTYSHKNPRTRRGPLNVTHPQLAKQAHGWDPSKHTQWSPAKVSWKCDFCGHIWEERIKNRAYRNVGCRLCAGRSPRGTELRHSLDVSHPALAADAFGWDPAAFTAISRKEMAWKCSKCGFEWKCSIRTRTLGYGKCKGCDKAVTFRAKLEASAWHCPSCDRSWETEAAGSSGSGCRKCVPIFKRHVLPLSVTHPSLAVEASGWCPDDCTAGSSEVKEWKCQLCGHEWTVSIKSRTGSQSGCKKCFRGLRRNEGPLSETHPSLAAEAQGWDPAVHYAGSTKVVSWCCSVCHTTWSTSINGRATGQVSCSICNKRKFSQPLTATHPALAAEADGWDPSKYTAGSYAALSWKCSECENQWTAPPAHRTRDFKKCKICFPAAERGGFDPAAAGYLYYLEGVREGVRITQYGITGNPDRRCATHRSNSFHPPEGTSFLYFPCGRDAQECETLIGIKLSQLNIPSIRSDSSVTDSFDGYTESFRSELLDTGSLEGLLAALGVEVSGQHEYVSSRSALQTSNF